ncbi:MAG: site-specific integrase [candidate division Zixibacteria bacterium]|nr:site-specific integrase [candidate division Zixibacteria bacterium]MDH3938941.1 site-specific integrase [candidate division Zixibacteria bacterium]MDH4032601.1 site-specific integrase [candidate division Zixibacteria bacterium]
MARISSKNEKIKRRYLRRLREAEGLAESTVLCVEKAVYLYEDFVRHEDYALFNQNKAINLKKWLLKRTHKGQTISISTVHGYLRHLKRFFTWLSDQPGYKSRINADSVSYLSLDKKQVREATARRLVDFPPLGYVEKLADSIVIKTEIDRRDQALIAFSFLSGMRDKAIATLPFGCFDRETLRVDQDPAKGVQTKFGKSFVSVLFPFSDKLREYVVGWAEYLEKHKHFAPTDPLFPKSKVEQESGGLTFVANEVDRNFWKGTGSIRSIFQKRSEMAGLAYYHPHTFRHAAIYLARKLCRNAEEIKAVSQNVGHEDVGTTMMTYGTLDQHRVSEVIRSMSFEEVTHDGMSSEELQVLEKVVKRHRKMT